MFAAGNVQLDWAEPEMYVCGLRSRLLTFAEQGGLQRRAFRFWVEDQQRMILYFAIFFALGYALYTVFFAIVAVTCTSTEEMTQSMMAASMPMVFAVMIAMNVVANPATPMTRVLCLVPFLTPLVMMARVNILMPPLWEVWLGIGLLAASTVAVAWIAAKIFRYALLMTGKRPTLPELLAVVRAR